MTSTEANNLIEEAGERIKELELRLERKRLTFDSLYRLIERLGTTLELDKIIRFFMMTLAGQLKLDHVSLYLFSNSTMNLILYHTLGRGKKDELGRINIGSGLGRWIVERKSMASIKEFVGRPAGMNGVVDGHARILIENGLEYSYPLIDGTDLIGAIIFGDKIGGGDLADFDIETLHMVVKVATMAIKNSVLYQTALQSKKEIENFSQVKNEFMHHTSHELRTPLTVLKSAIWSIETTESSNAMLIDMAKEATKQLQENVERVLSLSDIGLKDSLLDLRETDLFALLEACYRKVVPELGEKGVTLKLDRSIDRYYLMVDPSKMQIVISSIIDNAVCSVERGGTIQLGLTFSKDGPDDSAGVQLSGWKTTDESGDVFEILKRETDLEDDGSCVESGGITPTKGFIVITVKDNGIGIPSDEIRLISEPFHRASNSRISEVRGLGLGLSVSQKIIEGHCGQLYCKSTEGVGSEFSIWLPIRA